MSLPGGNQVSPLFNPCLQIQNPGLQAPPPWTRPCCEGQTPLPFKILRSFLRGLNRQVWWPRPPFLVVFCIFHVFFFFLSFSLKFAFSAPNTIMAGLTGAPRRLVNTTKRGVNLANPSGVSFFFIFVERNGIFMVFSSSVRLPHIHGPGRACRCFKKKVFVPPLTHPETTLWASTSPGALRGRQRALPSDEALSRRPNTTTI